MITIYGKGVSAGIAAGPLCFFRHARAEVTRGAAADAETEWKRFRDARAAASEQLGALAERARATAGDEAALLFETHRMMAEDPDYEEAVAEGVRGGMSAEAALADARERFAEQFAAMDDPYMRLRAADVRDISERILAILTGAAQGGFESDTPVILAADDLSPSETIQLDKGKILAIVTEGGAEVSHTAILARAMGIPAVVGAGGCLRAAYAGHEAIVDGEDGTVVLDPDAETRARLAEKRAEQLRERERLDRLRGGASVTRDGRRVRICCNAGDPGDVAAALANGGEGIGLFRSEFLYLGREAFPSEEEQFEAYRKALCAMGDREVVIRTLDIGADKQLGYFALPREENPAMGNRGLRVCLDRPDIFRTQLRALYRASAFGRLGILLPMVASVWEVREAKELCGQVRRELAAEGAAFADDVPVGVMIETPAAALLSDRLAKEADFFSCGTNDLAQYTLACDRQNGNLGRFFDPRHIAVLRLLKLVVDNAHRNGVRVGICGELGADPQMTETLLAIGFDELSVPPNRVLPLRQRVREADAALARARLLDELTYS